MTAERVGTMEQQDFFDQVTFARRESPEAPASSGNTYFELEGQGRVSPIFGGHRPRVYSMGRGRLSLGGVATPNGIVRESSFFDVYRVLDESRFEVSIFQQRYTGSSAFLSSPGEGPDIEPGIEDALFCINLYDNNYQHFLIETFPRLCLLAGLEAFSAYPIVMADWDFIREIAVLCFPGRDFVFLKQDEHLQVARHVVFCGAVARNFHPLADAVAPSLSFLREKALGAAERLDPARIPVRRCFFGRKPLPSSVGKDRQVSNHGDLEAVLGEMGIATADFDGKSLAEKARLLSDLRLGISPIGANLMNFLFVGKGARLIIVLHPNFGQWEFFASLFDAVGAGLVTVQAFPGVHLDDLDEKRINVPYRIDLASLGNVLRALPA